MRDESFKLPKILAMLEMKLIDSAQNDHSWLERSWNLLRKGHIVVFQSIIPDLRSLEWYQSVFLLFFAVCTVLVTVFDLNSVIENRNADDTDEESTWKKVFFYFSGLASFTGVMCVFLVSLGKISSFFWGVLNCLFYGLFSFAYGYAGDAQLNIIFVLPMQYVGALQWMDEMENKSKPTTNNDDINGELEPVPNMVVKTRSLSSTQWMISLVIATAITVFFYYEIPLFATALTGAYTFDGNVVPRSLDACSNGLSIVAQALLMLRFWQCWLFWIAVNGVQFTMFAGASGTGIDFNICIMLALFVLNAFYGLTLWYKNCYYESDGFSINDTQSYQAIESGSVHDNNAYSPLVPNKSEYQDTHVVFQSSEPSGSARSPIIGVVVGKFYPFHKGHQYLVDTALQNCDILHIIVCYKPGEQPDGPLRYDWVCELYGGIGRVVVHLLLDVYDPLDSELWARLTIETMNKSKMNSDSSIRPHVAFTNMARSSIPTSGTAVRSSPLSQWKFLSEPLRGYYAKRFVIVGAESTGKTTLSQLLAKNYSTQWVAEYGREYTDLKISNGAVAGKNSEFTSVEWSSADFQIIASQQNKNEICAARLANKVVICDTDSFATYLWHEHYLGVSDSSVLTIFNELMRLTDFKSRHYLLMDSEGVPFVQDGTRDGEHHRQWFYDRFLEEMHRLKLTYSILRGSYEDREAEARRIIDTFVVSSE